MKKDIRSQSSYRDLLEGSVSRSDPFDSIVSGHLQSRGGSSFIILLGALLIGAIVIPPLLSLLELF